MPPPPPPPPSSLFLLPLSRSSRSLLAPRQNLATLVRTKTTWTRVRPEVLTQRPALRKLPERVSWTHNKYAASVVDDKGYYGALHGSRGKREALISREMTPSEVLRMVGLCRDGIILNARDTATAFFVLKQSPKFALNIVANPDYAALIRMAHVHADADRLNAIGAANIIHAIGRLEQCPRGMTPRKMLDPLLGAIERLLSVCKTREICSVLWALGRMWYLPEAQVIDKLLSAAIGRRGEFKPQEISIALHALGRLRHRPADDQLLEGLLMPAMDQAEHFAPHNISATIHALGTLKYRPADDLVLEKLLRAAVLRMPEFKPREIADVLSALVRLQYTPTDASLLAPFLMSAFFKALAFSPIDVALTVSALSKFEPRPASTESTVDELLIVSMDKMLDWRPFEIVSIVSALGRLRHMPQQADVVDRLLRATAEKSSEFNGEDVAILMHGLGQLQYTPTDAEALKQLLLRTLTEHWDSLSPMNISSLLNALGKLEGRFDAGAVVVEKLVDAAMDRLGDFEPIEVIGALRGLGMLEHKPGSDAVLDRMLAAVVDKLDGLEAQDAASAVDALQRLDFCAANGEHLERLKKAAAGSDSV